MIPNFLNSEKIHAAYNVNFIYRRSEDYEKVLFSRVEKKGINYIPVKLPKQEVHRNLLKGFNKGGVLYKSISAIIVLFWKYYSISAAIPPLYKILKNKDIEILHVNNGGYPAANTSYSVVIAAKFCGIKKIVYVVNNIAADYKNPVRWLDLFIDPYIKKNVNLFITGSKFASSPLKNVLSINEDKVANIANGINPREVRINREDYLDSLKIKCKGRLIFSTIALLEERKGHIWLLKAIKILKESISLENLPIFIIEGEGSQKEKLKVFIKENDLENDVLLIGNTEYIFNLLNASDVIVLPSIGNEDFPNITIEAMSLGKPTIGTRIAGIPEQIDHNKNGIVVSPKNPEELAEAITILLNKDKIRVFSQNAFQKFNDNYTVNISVENYIKVYQSLT